MRPKVLNNLIMSHTHLVDACSLVPRPPPFLFFSLCSVYYTEAEERRENGEDLGTSYHVNDVRWTRGGRGGEGSAFKYME